MTVQPDQLLLYDTTVRQWVVDTFEDCVAGKQFFIMVGTPDRGFAEFVTPTGISPDGRAPLPRVALTLGDIEVDDERHNSNSIRKLGYTSTAEIDLYRAEYPVAVNLRYTLNFWAEYQREMNQYMIELLQAFKSQVKYIKVDIDSISPVAIYGDKDVGMYKDSGIYDTGDLEPAGKEKVMRRTFDFHLKAWLWDFNFGTAYVVKEFALEWYSDRDLTLLISTASTPQKDLAIFSGNGSQTVFSGNTFRTPIVSNTFLLDAIVGSVNVRVRDDGAGVLVDPVDSSISGGTIDYSTGAISVTYVTAPDASTDLNAAYFNTVD